MNQDTAGVWAAAWLNTYVTLSLERGEVAYAFCASQDQHGDGGATL
jgi:hypothetical protein